MKNQSTVSRLVRVFTPVDNGRTSCPTCLKARSILKDRIEVGRLAHIYRIENRCLSQKSAILLNARSREHDHDNADDPMLGTFLGKYEILRQIGKGSYGVVYSVKPKGINIEYALKLLPSNASVREAERLASLSCSHSVKVVEAISDEDFNYIVMEKLDQNLLERELKNEGTVSAIIAASHVRDAAIGVAALHSHGLVHRDIKPSNLLWDSSLGVYKIGDLGIAAPVQDGDVSSQVEVNRNKDDFHANLNHQETSKESAARTQLGLSRGTKGYASPQQYFYGSIRKTDDVYGLGMVLQDLLSHQRQHRSVPKMSFFRDNIYRILEKCLAADPRCRYVDAQELVDDLDRYRLHQPLAEEKGIPAVLKWCLLTWKYSAFFRYKIIATVFGLLLLISNYLTIRSQFQNQVSFAASSAISNMNKGANLMIQNPGSARELLNNALEQSVAVSRYRDMNSVLGMTNYNLAQLDLRVQDTKLAEERLRKSLEYWSKLNVLPADATLAKDLLSSLENHDQELILTIDSGIPSEKLGPMYARLGDQLIWNEDLGDKRFESIIPTYLKLQRKAVMYLENANSVDSESDSWVKTLAVRLNIVKANEVLEKHDDGVSELFEIMAMLEKAQTAVAIRKAWNLTHTDQFARAEEIVDAVLLSKPVLSPLGKYNLACILARLASRIESASTVHAEQLKRRAMDCLRLLDEQEIVGDIRLQCGIKDDPDLDPIRKAADFIEWRKWVEKVIEHQNR